MVGVGVAVVVVVGVVGAVAIAVVGAIGVVGAVAIAVVVAIGVVIVVVVGVGVAVVVVVGVGVGVGAITGRNVTRMKITIGVVALAIGAGMVGAGSVQAQRWGAAETALASAATVGWAVDALQSSAMQRQGYWETNRVLGLHPSDAAIGVYFTAAIGATWTLPRLIQNPWARRIVLAAVAVSEARYVLHNRSIGVRLQW